VSRSEARRVPVIGTLAPHVGGFCDELERQGYASASAVDQVRLMAHLSRWLADGGLDLAKLTSERVEQFLGARRERYVRLISLRALAPLLGYLRALELIPDAPRSLAETPVERLLEDYHGYLVVERGMAAGSVRLYERSARLFMLERCEPLALDLEQLGAAEVRGFVVRECSGRSVASARTLVTALRSLLRFLYVEGWTPRPLSGAVPSVAGWSVGSLPRAVDADVVARLLASCDVGTAVGCRDRAIIVLLARLGLRVHEVAGLGLDDLDWRAGELTIHGKGGRRDRLPLVQDVGDALAAYLQRARPQCASRRVFVSVRAPLAPLSAGGVASVVRDACRRAGLPRVGAHRLRHTAATEMLRRGATLPEIGQVLRHRDLLTTALYAKVDRRALSALARPWPETPR
jgi:integrase/recombinase XerD